MPLELQSHFGIDYIYAGGVLEGVALTATILESLKRQGIFNYANAHSALVLGIGNAPEMFTFSRLGIPYILGVDDDSMLDTWGVVREDVLAKTPNSETVLGVTFASWLNQYHGDPFDLMITIQSPGRFWDGVDWDRVAYLLTKGGVFVIDGDDAPDEHGFPEALSLTWFFPDYQIALPAQVHDLTNDTNTIYQAREQMYKRRVQLARHR